MHFDHPPSHLMSRAIPEIDAKNEGTDLGEDDANSKIEPPSSGAEYTEEEVEEEVEEEEETIKEGSA